MHNITAGTKLLVFSLKHKNNAHEQYSLKNNLKCYHCIIRLIQTAMRELTNKMNIKVFKHLL